MSYNLYDYNIKIFFDELDNDYVAFIEEIPECSAFGSTAESALRKLEIAFEGWMEAIIKRGHPIPEPIDDACKLSF
ncbi:MAG: type II toxin-antitoxin system HicB family antitoxin [Candidatus Eremiobacteraeota bacterium]|nr:type II toxin-antitoxin system HicB family antitoxin [Candidatus Eremiobacteraeota bacterium]